MQTPGGSAKHKSGGGCLWITRGDVAFWHTQAEYSPQKEGAQIPGA